MIEKTYYIIDFDSTFVRIEALDKLAEISLRKNPEKQKRIKKISDITAQGMRGEIPFDVSLSKRLALFQASKKDIESLIRILKRNITPSMERNKEFFHLYRDVIYIITGGFKDYVYPLFKPFGIDESHILANQFQFDSNGKVNGFDTNNFLAHEGGKVKQIQKLHLKGNIYVIGDGYTDMQIKTAGSASKFFVFCENVTRESVTKKADYVLPNFDEFLYLLDLPRAYSYPKNRITVLLLEQIHERAVSLLEEEGYTVEIVPRACDEEELAKRIKNISILGIRSKTVINQRVLANAPHLLAIGAFCIGTNQIDLSNSAERGVAVFNAPYSNTRSVVELIMGEIIMLARKVFDKSQKLHQGIWDKSSDGCFEIRGKTLGIIGYGNIGSQLSVLAEMLGMEVLYYDREEKLALGNAKKCASLHEVLRAADFVTVHVDGSPSNMHLLGDEELNVMKPGAKLLNASRGFVVDLEALVKYLRNGSLGGAAIDVFPSEPTETREKFFSELQGLPQVILTPHIGGNTIEAQSTIGEFVAQKIIRFINTGDTSLSVNLPSVALPPLTQSRRILHIHRNVPGVLAQINTIFAGQNINILGQYLSTKNTVGMAITDVSTVRDTSVIKQLRSIPETIKLRVLY